VNKAEKPETRQSDPRQGDDKGDKSKPVSKEQKEKERLERL